MQVALTKSSRKPIRFDGQLPDEPSNAIQVFGG